MVQFLVIFGNFLLLEISGLSTKWGGKISWDKTTSEKYCSC